VRTLVGCAQKMLRLEKMRLSLIVLGGARQLMPRSAGPKASRAVSITTSFLTTYHSQNSVSSD
jgi:hypothetical protein